MHTRFQDDAAPQPGARTLPTVSWRRRCVCALLTGSALIGACALAQDGSELDQTLNERVLQVDKKTALFTIKLETTVYKPDGAGPFPVVVINHGKAAGNPRFQPRYRPTVAARYFLERGYAVVVPMRQGFSMSGGSYVGGGCNAESNGRVQAEDVKAVLDYLAGQPWADMQRILVVGQSHGGWTALAFGALGYPGVRGIVNFAGGLRQETCPNWRDELAGGAAGYARQTRVPSLWFYGDNDSYFDEPTYRAMFERYSNAGGRATLIAFGRFGPDAHTLFGSQAGARIWQPELSRFLASIGLPDRAQPQFARFGAGAAVAGAPSRTKFTPRDNDSRVPRVGDAGNQGAVRYGAWSSTDAAPKR